jgi:hypothetical protein
MLAVTHEYEVGCMSGRASYYTQVEYDYFFLMRNVHARELRHIKINLAF